MFNSSFPSYPLNQVVLKDLLVSIGQDRVLWAPRTGPDGLCRLQLVSEEDLPSLASLTFIPLKKLLLPPREAVWTHAAGQFSAVDVPEPFAVIGVPLCDLQAIWYLDQVFADDEVYQSRRMQSLLVGMACEPGPDCRCDGQLMPVAGDIFVGRERVWAISAAGDSLIRSAGFSSPDTDVMLPWPEGTAEKRQNLLEEQFYSGLDASVWEEEGKRCLSCGACSVVCPTCYCFDMLDVAAVDGTVTRHRVWDNCFFAEHGEVAGGHDFRPGRANRLRFRMEHKFFGFGILRGQNSCVRCGRCHKVCPVDIDLDRIAEQLVGEGFS
ncbi:MAG: 4Fe-4S ferredoxin [Deltaproteobacteria bacterium]|nr:MAG: 4Fe-4S ferredoxin [Deltaproteobacteria bacterium]